MEICSSFRMLFEPFSAVFSVWTTLMTGWVLSHRHRYVTDLIVSSAATRDGAWCNFHRFFSRYKWSLDDVCRVTARLVIDTLVPRDAVITLRWKRQDALFYGVGKDRLMSIILVEDVREGRQPVAGRRVFRGGNSCLSGRRKVLSTRSNDRPDHWSQTLVPASAVDACHSK